MGLAMCEEKRLPGFVHIRKPSGQDYARSLTLGDLTEPVIRNNAQVMLVSEYELLALNPWSGPVIVGLVLFPSEKVSISYPTASSEAAFCRISFLPTDTLVEGECDEFLLREGSYYALDAHLGVCPVSQIRIHAIQELVVGQDKYRPVSQLRRQAVPSRVPVMYEKGQCLARLTPFFPSRPKP